MWTKERIARLLNTNDLAVDRALSVLYDRQTQDEKGTSTTKHSNGRGFKSNHAVRGSYYGRWVQSGKRLTGGHLVKARHIALQYTGQLADEANAKSARTELPVGSYAATARALVEMGIMTGDEADSWKDAMKDG